MEQHKKFESEKNKDDFNLNGKIKLLVSNKA